MRSFYGVGRIVAEDPTRALRDAVMCQVGKHLSCLISPKWTPLMQLGWEILSF